MTRSKPSFDVTIFLAKIGKGRKIVRVRKKQQIYVQGASCNSVFYIQKGKVRLTVVSKAGKEATIAILNASDFFGEGALAGRLDASVPPKPWRIAYLCALRRVQCS